MVDRKTVAVAVVAVVVVGAGIAGFFLLGETTGEDVGEQMEERFAEIEDYEGTMTANSVRVAQQPEPMTEQEMERQARIAAEEGPMSYEEALESIRESQPEGGTVVVYNQTNTAQVRYMAPDKLRYDYEEDPGAIVSNTGAVTLERDRAYFHRADGPPTEQDRSVVSVTTIGIPLDDYVPTITEDYEIEIDENETDGETYVLNLTAKEDANVNLEIDLLWVDREEMVPVRAYRRAEQRDEFGAPTGDYTEQTIEYDYEYNVGVDESAFEVNVVEVDRPEPAETNESGTAEYEPVVGEENTTAFEERTIERFDNIEDAEEAAGFEISEPTYMPSEDFELSRVTVRTEDGVSAIDPTYRNESTRFLMRYSEDFRTFASDIPEDAPATTEEVEVGDTTGELLTLPGLSILTVECGNQTAEATSPDVPSDELIQVVESVDC